MAITYVFSDKIFTFVFSSFLFRFFNYSVGFLELSFHNV